MTEKTGQELFRDKIRRNNSSISGTIVAEQKMKQNEGLPLFGNGYAGNFFGGIGSQFLGGTGDLMTSLKLDTPANWLYSGENWINERLKPAKPAEFSWDYITSPEGLARGAGNTAGSVASILLPTAALPGGTAGTIGRGLTKLPGVGKLFSPNTANMTGRFFMSGLPEAGMEQGNAYRNAVAQGMNPQEAWDKSKDVFWKNAAFLPMSNAVQYGLFGKLFGKRPFVSAGGELGSQGLEEGYQEAFQRAMTGLPYTYNPIEMVTNPKYEPQKQAMTEGFMGFLPFTAAGYAGGRVRNWLAPDKKADDTARKDDTRTDTTQQETPAQGTKEMRSWAGKHSGGYMSDEVFDELKRASQKYGVPFDHVLATAIKESNGEHYQGDGVTTSPVGALGVMQLMPDTAESLGVDPFDLKQNIDGGVRYLKQMYDQFGDWDLAHAAYNAGPGAVERYGGIPDYGETQDYVARINGYLNDSPNYQGDDSSQADEQPTNENIFGVENYDMPVAEMESTVEGLKPGWTEIIPQIGGVLKSMGYDPVLTSAARTREHQMRINPDAPNSYHIIQDDGGDAIDISLSEGALTPEQEQAVLDYFKGTGLFNEVLYHSVVGGKHLHLGGLNVDKLKSAAPKGSNTRTTGTTSDGSVTEEETTDAESSATPLNFQEIIANILRDNDNATFDISSNDAGTQEILSTFATDKRDTATGEAALKLQEMFDSDGQFIQSLKNRKTLNELFGDELQTFGQGQMNQRWSELLKKTMTPNFVEDLSEDDRKFFGNILKQKLKAAGVDLKGMGTTLQGLERGDEKTFLNAWQAIQDRLKTSTEPLISEKTQKALDDIAARIDELTPNRADNAPQIAAHANLYKEIRKLNDEISKLTTERDKLSTTPGNQAAKVEAASKIAKLDETIKTKQDALDAKIDNFYNPPQPAEVEPINETVANELAALSQRKAELRATGGNAKEVTALNHRRDKILKDNDAIAKLNQQASTLEVQIANEPDAQRRESLQDKLDALNADIETKTAKLSNFINPPQPAKVEPSKRFAPVKAKADNAIASLNRQIETRKAQGVAEDSSELEKLTDDKFALQALVEDLASLDEQAATAKKKQTAAEKANDAKARETARKQFNTALGKYKKKEQALLELLNPSPPQETFEPRNDGEANALEAIRQQKAQLRSEGGRYKEVTELNNRRDKIQEGSKEIRALENQAAALENQIANEPDAQRRESLQDKLDALNADIVKKDTKLQNYMNPPQKPAPKTYAPTDTVAKEISRLNREILNAPDSAESDGSVKKANDRINKLLRLNNAVGQAQDQFNQAASELTAARQSGDDQAQIAAKTAFETAKENLSAKQKELDEYLNPPAKPKPAPFEPVDETVAQRVADLNSRIEAEQDASTVNALRKERDAIQTQNNAALKWKRQPDEQAAIMNDAGKTAAERLKAKESHAAASVKYDAEKTKLDELLNPRNEDEEPVETFEPVNDAVRDALARLDRQIADAPENSTEQEELDRQRRELQAQNDKVASLQDEKKALQESLSRKTKGSKGYDKVQRALDNKSKTLTTAKKTLDKFVNATKPAPVE